MQIYILSISDFKKEWDYQDYWGLCVLSLSIYFYGNQNEQS